MTQFDFPLKSFFLALPLENEAKWQFQALQEELKGFSDVLRFQNPQTPHLTLMYWPEVLQLEYEGICKQTEKLAGSHRPFTVTVTKAETFGSRGEDRVLYLDISFSDELARVKKDCPWSEGRPFTPHITLARISHPQKFTVHKKKIMKLLADCQFSITFNRLQLYAEINHQKQTPLTSYPLLLT